MSETAAESSAKCASGSADCPICYEEITAATGKVGLGCSHEFHFSCISQWFIQQKKKDLSEGCPLCRQEGGEKSKLPEDCVKGGFDDDEDDDEEDEDDEGSWDDYHGGSYATGYFLANFVDKGEVATKIQAIWRSHKVRLDNKEELDAKGLLKLAAALQVHFAEYDEGGYDHAGEVVDFDFQTNEYKNH